MDDYYSFDNLEVSLFFNSSITVKSNNIFVLEKFNQLLVFADGKLLLLNYLFFDNSIFNEIKNKKSFIMQSCFDQ